MREQLNPLRADPKSITQYRQNKVKYVVEDLSDFLDLSLVEQEVVKKILLTRGINKWLSCRREIIALKNEMKGEIRETLAQISWCKKNGSWKEHRELVGRLKALEAARKRLRQICHKDRWQPDVE